MKKGDTIPGIISVLFGAMFVLATTINPQLTFEGKTSDGVPGAGFFPYLLGGLIIIFGIALVVRGIKQNGTVQFVVLDEEGKKNVRTLIFSIIGLIVFLVVWKFTGWFIPLVFVLSLYFNKLFERTIKFNLIYSVVVTIFIYLVFVMGFSIQFVA